jgi:hypothetical protein
VTTARDDQRGRQQTSWRQRPEGRSEKAVSGQDQAGDATAWTKRNKKGGEFMAVKKPAKKKKAAEKFKGVRREK